jgi:hypothetical protein
MVAHTCNSSSWEAEIGVSPIKFSLGKKLSSPYLNKKVRHSDAHCNPGYLGDI